jgi:hypothetical protein
MISFKRYFILIAIVFFSFTITSLPQVKKIKSKAPKLTFTAAVSYNFALSKAYGDVTTCNMIFDSSLGGYIFGSTNYGMQQGGSIMTIFKLAVDKKRRIRLVSNLGYSLFYNTAFDNQHKNQWHIFNGSFGIEYNFRPKAKFRPYVGYELLYTLMFGGWQCTSYNGLDVVDIYVKFKPAHRLGMAINSGFEFKINKKIGLTLGYRAVWVNILLKQNKFSNDVEVAYLNDAKSDNGIEPGYRKQIAYLQLIGGVSFFIGRR